uniref:Uncharacterized protein n=1 Tax=Amphimedon queenslandica TaxID=400682 RepID=A0A1X7T960_AMPQE
MKRNNIENKGEVLPFSCLWYMIFLGHGTHSTCNI